MSFVQPPLFGKRNYREKFIPPPSTPPSSVGAGQSRLFPTYPYKTPVAQMGYSQFGAPGKGVLQITPETLEALEDYIAWCESVGGKKLRQADNMLAKTLAYIAGSYALKFSAGMKRRPEDTSRSWKWPIPRVTGKYFESWRIIRERHAVYRLTNDSREAYFIEYGIHRNPATGQPSPRRIRRPVFKRTMIELEKQVHSSPLANRFWNGVIIPKPGEPGRRTKLIEWSQPSGVMGEQPTIAGVGPTFAPGGYGFIKMFESGR